MSIRPILAAMYQDRAERARRQRRCRQRVALACLLATGFLVAAAVAWGRDVRTVRAQDPLDAVKVGDVVWRLDSMGYVVECKVVAPNGWRRCAGTAILVEWEEFYDICGGTCWSTFEFERSRGRLFATKAEADSYRVRREAWEKMVRETEKALRDTEPPR